MSGHEKKAMSDAERHKIIKAAILSGGIAALIGAMSRDSKSKERRKKSLNPEESSNAIIVPISKRDFVRDLPTPRQLAESRAGESLNPGGNDTQGPAAGAISSDLSPDAISAKKKEILRERKFDFFGGLGKKAAKDDLDDKNAKSDTPEANKARDGKNGDRIVLRSPDGRFASPSGPVAAGQVEKNAGILSYLSSAISSAFSPIDSGKKIFDVATGKPLWIAGGALGSVYVAEKISEAINKRRRERSKERLEKARDKYVDILEGGDGAEKTAEDDPNGFERPTGLALGTAFFIPAAITALVASRIHENRRAEKKKKKEMSDSYPADPYIMYKVIDGPGEEKVAEADDMPRILYKTAEGKEVEISADTALMVMSIKEAMFEDAERAEIASAIEKAGNSLEKSAQQTYRFSDEEYNDAIKDAIKYVEKDDNSDDVLKRIDAYRKGQAYNDEIPWYKKMWMPKTWDSGIYKDPEFKRRLLQNSGFQDALVDQFGSNKKFIKYKNNEINDRIGSWLVDHGINKGGVLHQIISWLAQNLGIGGMMFNSNLRDELGNIGNGIAAQERAAAIEQVKRMKPDDKGYGEAYNNLIARYPDAKNEVEPPGQIGVGAQNRQPTQPPPQPPDQQTPAQTPAQAQAQQPAQQQQPQPYNWPMFMKDYWPRSTQEALEGSFRGDPASVPTSVAQPTPYTDPSHPYDMSKSLQSPPGEAVAPPNRGTWDQRLEKADAEDKARLSQTLPTWEDLNDAMYNADRNAESTVTHRVGLPQRQKAPPGMRWVPNYGYITEQEYQNNLSGAPKTTTVGQDSDFAPDFKNPDGSDDLDGMVNYLENGDDEQFAQGIPSQAKNTF